MLPHEQSRGGNGSNQYQSGNPTNVGMAPTASDHAEEIGVDRKSEINPQNCGMVPTASDHAEDIGVRQNGSHKRFEEGPSNDGAIPTASDHAEDIGVTSRTVENWENDEVPSV